VPVRYPGRMDDHAKTDASGGIDTVLLEWMR
jgi:hypothetical protein